MSEAVYEMGNNGEGDCEGNCLDQANLASDRWLGAGSTKDDERKSNPMPIMTTVMLACMRDAATCVVERAMVCAKV